MRVGTLTLRLRAIDRLVFPPGKAGNTFRGAFGDILRGSPAFARIFAPKRYSGPSGLSDPPRPFVLRAAHLDGKVFEPDEHLSLDINIFDLHHSLPEIFAYAFGQLARTGLGPRRARLELLTPEARPVITDIDLTGTAPVAQTHVIFQTPTDLKGNPARDDLPFRILFDRVRGRVCTLQTLYGDRVPDFDFKEMSDRAALVRTAQCDLAWSSVSRRSSRTGNVHGIGGFTGTADYEGNLTEFMPWLHAARLTGIGRHTVWGNGVIDCA